jgi:hypothetical protein
VTIKPGIRFARRKPVRRTTCLSSLISSTRGSVSASRLAPRFAFRISGGLSPLFYQGAQIFELINLAILPSAQLGRSPGPANFSWPREEVRNTFSRPRLPCLPRRKPADLVTSCRKKCAKREKREKSPPACYFCL